MKKIILTLSMLILTITLVACSNKLETNFSLMGDVAKFTNEEFETYVDHRRNKDYDGSMMINEDNELETNFYVWGNDLRKELRLQFSFINEELFKIHETKVYKFEVELTERLIITFNTRLLVSLEKNRATTLIALMLPKEFYSTRENLRVGLILSSYSLEVIDDNTVTQIKTTSTKELTHQYDRKLITKNNFYSFETNEELLSIINNTYTPRTLNINTEDVRSMDLNEMTIGKIFHGRYHWYKFVSPVSSDIKITAFAGFGFTIEIYNDINGEVLLKKQFTKKGDKLVKNTFVGEEIYIKIYYTEFAKTDYFGFVAELDTN